MLRFEKRSAQELSRNRADSDLDAVSNTNTATDAAADSNTIFTWRSRRSSVSDADADSVPTWWAHPRSEQPAETNPNAKEETAAN